MSQPRTGLPTKTCLFLQPSDADMKKMQDEYWVAKAGPASDLSKLMVDSFWSHAFACLGAYHHAILPARSFPFQPSDADMKKMQDEYWVAKAGPASDLTKLGVCPAALCHSHAPAGALQHRRFNTFPFPQPSDADMKKMQDEYWVGPPRTSLTCRCGTALL